ncbi:MAG: B12-binding domain-containing radical SAM protein [Elusimicrobia bacterium]|nr:B12-binding domain-containing radical SAM protein [Elusimicrobiota bacterium]
MKILLIIPPVVYKRQPSIGVAYISAYLREKGYDIEVWDLNTEVYGINDGDDGYWAREDNARRFISGNGSLFESWAERAAASGADIIGFNVWSTSRLQSLHLADKIKEKSAGTLIVFGGPETSLADRLFVDEKAVDILVKGEGERALEEIAVQFGKNGRVDSVKGCMIRKGHSMADFGECAQVPDIDRLPVPDFSDFSPEKYLFRGHVPISFSRGCRWRCAFCTVENCWQGYRSRSPAGIYSEMKLRLRELPVKQFVNCDPALNQDPVQLSELCDMIIKDGLDIRWDGMAQIAPHMEPGLLGRMKKAGCVLLNYGVESGSASVLGKMGKRYSPDTAKKVIEDTHRAGIDVVLNFIVGFPGETENDFSDTLEFVKSVRARVLNIAYGHPCLVVPYNRLYTRPEKYGIVFDEEDSYNWKTLDGSNNARLREERAGIFDSLLKNLDIDARCGQDDRGIIEGGAGGKE